MRKSILAQFFTFSFLLQINAQIGFVTIDEGLISSTSRAIYYVDLNSDGTDEIVLSSGKDIVAGVFENFNYNLNVVSSSTFFVNLSPPVDANGDGNMDLVVTVAGGSNAGTHIAYGNGTTTPDPLQKVSSQPSQFTLLVDVDGDEILDTLICDSNAGKLILDKGDPLKNDVIIDDDIAGVKKAEIIDFDNDGDLDIVALGTSADKLAVYINDGACQFGEVDLLTGDSPLDFNCVEMTSDEYVDIISANPNGLQIHENQINTNFKFELISEIDSDIPLFAINNIDVDNDGDQDIITAGFGNNGTSVYLNQGKFDFTQQVIGSAIEVYAFGVKESSNEVVYGTFSSQGPILRRHVFFEKLTKNILATKRTDKIEQLKAVNSKLIFIRAGANIRKFFEQPDQTWMSQQIQDPVSGPLNTTSMEICDIDGDDDMEILVGSQTGSFVSDCNQIWDCPQLVQLTTTNSSKTVCANIEGTTDQSLIVELDKGASELNFLVADASTATSVQSVQVSDTPFDIKVQTTDIPNLLKIAVLTSPSLILLDYDTQLNEVTNETSHQYSASIDDGKIAACDHFSSAKDNSYYIKKTTNIPNEEPKTDLTQTTFDFFNETFDRAVLGKNLGKNLKVAVDDDFNIDESPEKDVLIADESLMALMFKPPVLRTTDDDFQIKYLVGDFPLPSAMTLFDMDDDGDKDIIAASEADSTIVWFENPFGDAVAPVLFSNFSADKLLSSVKLKWATSSEINNKGFAVQRSVDARQWENIAWVEAQREDGRGSHYSMVDKTPVEGKNYYRLKQIDQNGSYMFSVIKLVNFENTVSNILIFPNPADNELYIDFPVSEEIVSYIIYAMNGQVKSQGLVKNNKVFISSLHTGSYIIELANDRGVLTKTTFIKN